jgi:hypothetical protein
MELWLFFLPQFASHPSLLCLVPSLLPHIKYPGLLEGLGAVASCPESKHVFWSSSALALVLPESVDLVGLVLCHAEWDKTMSWLLDECTGRLGQGELQMLELLLPMAQKAPHIPSSLCQTMQQCLQNRLATETRNQLLCLASLCLGKCEPTHAFLALLVHLSCTEIRLVIEQPDSDANYRLVSSLVIVLQHTVETLDSDWESALLLSTLNALDSMMGPVTDYLVECSTLEWSDLADLLLDWTLCWARSVGPESSPLATNQLARLERLSLALPCSLQKRLVDVQDWLIV